uniref:Uncharacterized protein n=1 Tax=Pyrodinium bahamense TaxID=73915 RepID=A0A7S0A3M6_9DINO
MAVDDSVDLDEEAMELSQVGKTIDGAGYTYFQLDCVGKKIGRIALLEEYEHLRQINLSGNHIEDVSPLSKLGHVLKLNLANNMIESIDAWGSSALCHLLYLNLSGNKLKALPKLYMPALKQASFAGNQIVTCAEFRGHSRLQVLDLSANRELDCLNGIRDMPLLETLNVAENALPGLGGVRALPSLKALNLSKNSFETLEGPWEEMASLQSLDASGNRIAAAKEFEPLSRLPELRRIEVAGNPLEEQEGVNIRHEVIICHRRIEAIDGQEVTEDEREEARALYEQRIEEERERQRLEEEAKKEQEANGEAEE